MNRNSLFQKCLIDSFSKTSSPLAFAGENLFIFFLPVWFIQCLHKYVLNVSHPVPLWGALGREGHLLCWAVQSRLLPSACVGLQDLFRFPTSSWSSLAAFLVYDMFHLDFQIYCHSVYNEYISLYISNSLCFFSCGRSLLFPFWKWVLCYCMIWQSEGASFLFHCPRAFYNCWLTFWSEIKNLSESIGICGRKC